ncbi:MAG: DUF362 domain-containing protein [Bacteroidales bacterium]
MKSFVDIIPFWKKEEDRIIEKLSLVYDDHDLLYKNIKSLIVKHIDIDNIKNKNILLKPNWVKHNQKETDKICLCTHESFILTTLEVLLELKPKSVLIGDAPIQGCNWDLLLSETFYKQVDLLSNKFNIKVSIKDFRRVAFDPKTNVLETEKNSLDNYIIFDVGTKSYLEDITSSRNTFRVTCYNPDRLAESHNFGTHKYCITKEVFEYDTIITLPKIKTHQKSGLTNSLKILVGVNGDKDYLPHHRIGALGHGGDCYKGYHPLRRLSELILDEANRNIGKRIYKFYSYLSAALWKLSFPKPEQNLAAGWYGNDTVWRMVMDINLISVFGKRDGTFADKPQRILYTLCDGIIGGQGNGPLSPEPLPLGIISFSNDSFLMDEIIGYIFRLNIDKIPLLKEAKNLNTDKEIELYLNGEITHLENLLKYSTDVIMPPGWVNYNK